MWDPLFSRARSSYTRRERHREREPVFFNLPTAAEEGGSDARLRQGVTTDGGG
jgi:hypothetical protein